MNTKDYNNENDKVFFNNTTKRNSKSSYIQTSFLKKKKQQTQDIFEIHNQILKILDDEYNKLPELKNKEKSLKWILENTNNSIEKSKAYKEITKIQNEITLIEMGYREAKYLYSIEPIIEEYNNILNEPIVVDFMNNKTNNRKEQLKNNLSKFLSIAKDYINVKPLETKKINTFCVECNIELQKEDDFLFVCPLCGFTIKHFASISSYQENNRMNVSQRYIYDKKAHFGDSIKKYQSKQNTTISKNVYDDLWNKIHNHDIPVKKITKDHLYDFLKNTGHSDHYEDINLIYSEITKNPPNDISYIEQKLFSLFDQIDPVYERIKPEGRTNFLNGQYVLFKLLQKLKHPCNEDEFYILKTREKMLEHDQIWKKICTELSWTYIATV